MGGYHSTFFLLIMVLLIFLYLNSRKIKIAVIVNRRKHHKKENTEVVHMKELAERFVGKECLINTLMSETSLIKGTIVEVTDAGILVQAEKSLEAVNLEYVVRIREWPRNSKGKKKSVIID